MICENSENETTLFLQGEEGKDKDALSEAGKAVEKNSDTYKSVSPGLIRGLNYYTPTLMPRTRNTRSFTDGASPTPRRPSTLPRTIRASEEKPSDATSRASRRLPARTRRVEEDP